MLTSRNRVLFLPLAALAITVPFLALKCTGSIKATHAATCGYSEEIGVSITREFATISNLSTKVTPPSWLELKDVTPSASVLLQSKDSGGNTIAQSLSLPFSSPSAHIVQMPSNAIVWDFASSPDQQSALDSFMTQAAPSYPVDATASIVVGDVRILAISSAVYQPYEIDVRLYDNGNEIGQYVGTQSLSGLWKDYLLSAISQVPPDAWTIHLLGKPPYEDTVYYKNLLIAKVTTAMGNFSNQNATLSNTNLLSAMSHLDGGGDTQYIVDPAARDNLYGIFFKVQQHVQNVANGVPETP